MVGIFVRVAALAAIPMLSSVALAQPAAPGIPVTVTPALAALPRSVKSTGGGSGGDGGCGGGLETETDLLVPREGEPRGQGASSVLVVCADVLPALPHT